MARRGPSEHLTTGLRPMHGARGSASEATYLYHLRQAAQPLVLGGALGGTCVGVLESLQILRAAFGTQDYSGLAYAVLLYGAFGATLGLLLSVPLGLRGRLAGDPADPARTWSIGFLTVFGALGTIITLFVVRRDVFGEDALPAPVVVGVVVAYALFVVGCHAFLRNALAKTFFGFLLRPVGTLSAYGGVLLFTLLLGLGTALDNRAGADVPARPIAAEVAERPDMLLIVVDTLRADALGVYGAGEDASPNIDRFAREAVVYRESISASSWTRPAFASLLTASPPCTHQTFRKSDVLPSELVTLPEALHHSGYTTGAIVGDINITPSFRFQQGFDTFEFLRPSYPFRASETSFRLTLYAALRLSWERWIAPRKRVDRFYRDASVVTKEAQEWLRRHGRSRWFLMVHYMDPHDPYFAHPYDGTAVSRVQTPRPRDEEAQRTRDLYAGEVAYTDEHLGRLLDWMDGEGMLENTAVVITADHGEEFGEHGGWWHGTRLYDEQIRVPLIVRYPDGAGPTAAVTSDLVRSIDVAPTLAELGGAHPGPRWQGVSLLREYELRAPLERVGLAETVFEGWGSAAVRGRDWKLIRNERARPRFEPRPPSELFFLRADPQEQRDLATDAAARWASDRKAAQLAALRREACGQAVTREVREAPLPPADCEALRALGYLDIRSATCAGP
jgi:arylsulfatase A-like enzyme